MSGHTPIPWRVDPAANCDIQTGDGKFEIASTHPGILNGGINLPGKAQANAAFIVLACNSHGELISALEVIAGGRVDASDTAIIVGDGACTAMAQVRGALAKAKGEAL